MFPDSVSAAPRAWERSADRGLFLGPQSVLGGAGTNLDEVDERLGEVAGVITQLVVVVFVAEDALEGREWLTISLKSSVFCIIVEKMQSVGSAKRVSRVCRERMFGFCSSEMLVLSSIDEEEEEEDWEGFNT